MSPSARRWSVIILALVVLGGTGWFVHTHRAAVLEVSQLAIARCREAGPAVFFAAMALLPCLGFPLAPFSLAAGPAFGPTLGTPAVLGCASLAITVNVALSYWLAARWMRPVMARLVTALGYRLPELRGNSAWIATLTLRIVPGAPFFMQSYLLGLARVPFPIYLSVSALIPMGYVSCVILFGDAIARGDRRATIAAIALMIGVAVILHLLRKRLPPAPAASPGSVPPA